MTAAMFDQVRKDATVTSVHVPTALGNQKKPKARLFGDVHPAAKRILETAGPTQRTLEQLDSQRSKMPIRYDMRALAKLREDQVPRFLGVLTNPNLLGTKDVEIDKLIATQNRVDTAKVKAMASSGGESAAPPTVVKFAGEHYIADGHHRVVAAWLRGDKTIKARFKDLEPESNAMKRDPWSIPFQVKKTDADRQLLFGWASIVTKNGVPIIDKQGDIIPVSVLEDAVYDFNLTAKRSHNDMHVLDDTGTLVESMMFTKAKQDALNIDLGHEGWWTGWKVTDSNVWSAYKSGSRPEFSIGGNAVPVPVEF